MMCVVPQSDHWPGQLVLIAHGTQACCAKHEPFGIYCNFKPNPARRQYSNEMPAGKKQHISLHRAQATHDAIGPRCGLGWRFPSWSAVAEQFPAGALAVDVDSTTTLVITIVPFEQILVDFSHSSKTSQ